MERAGAMFARNVKLNRKIKSAMVYPMVLLTLIIGVVVLMMVVVIPQFRTLFDQNNAELPGLTVLMITISDAFRYYWYIILGVAAAIVVGVKMWLSSPPGRLAFDRFKLKMPVVGKLLVKVYAARYSRTFSSLTSAGVPLIEAIRVTARSIINRHIEEELYEVANAVNRGEGLSGPLDKIEALPKTVVYMTRIGEESGTMSELLGRIADMYDDEAETALQALTALMEPAMIILMALIILPIVLAVILPVFSMYQLAV
jgi:type IV pilus assembly protein PilC